MSLAYLLGLIAMLAPANSVALVTTSVPRHRMRFALGIQAGAPAFVVLAVVSAVAAASALASRERG